MTAYVESKPFWGISEERLKLVLSQVDAETAKAIAHRMQNDAFAELIVDRLYSSNTPNEVEVAEFLTSIVKTNILSNTNLNK